MMSKLTDKLKKDLQSGPVDKADQMVILTHLFIGILIWFTYQSHFLDKELIRNFTSRYLFLLPFILIGLFFRKLRKIRFYLIWLIISLIQIFIYSKLKDNPDFIIPRGTAFGGLTGLLPTLIMYQLLRQIFYSIKEKEMIISLQKGRMTMFEKEDRRNMTWLDIAFSIILGLTAALSGPLLTSWDN
jgi:hypothetical protein